MPFAVGGLLVVQFVALGAWQIGRGLEKRETRALYSAETDFTNFSSGMHVRPFQRLTARGDYDNDRQFVLDNIIVNNRYGHYVLTALDIGDGEPLLLVNRGWIEQTVFDANEITPPKGTVAVRGQAGSLPRPGYKMGDAFADSGGWPKHAVFPDRAEIEAQLGRPVQPVVLLMHHEDEGGYLRQWAPTDFGPAKHFGYALQWFAMGAVLSGLLIWNYRKRTFKE